MRELWSLGVVMLLAPGISMGAIVYTKAAPVSKVWTWSQTASSVDGDTVLHLDTGLAECPAGVFIQDAENSDKAYSAALTAYTTGKPIRVQVFNDLYWTGSSTPYCKVRAIYLE